MNEIELAHLADTLEALAAACEYHLISSQASLTDTERALLQQELRRRGCSITVIKSGTLKYKLDLADLTFTNLTVGR